MRRRRFLAVQAALAAVPLSASGATGAAHAPRTHLVLLGDSVFDNAAYTGGRPAVIDRLVERLPDGWKATLLAVDGATTAGIAGQLAKLPADATHLVLSVGGNDALGRQDVLARRSENVGDALRQMASVLREFEAAYRRAVDACLAHRLPLTVCTVYNGQFADAAFQQAATVAIALFDDVIARVAAEKQAGLIDLRRVCTRPEDFANPIEPSSQGAVRIAEAILQHVRLA